MSIKIALAKNYFKINTSARIELYESLIEDVKLTTLKSALSSHISLITSPWSIEKAAMKAWVSGLEMGQTEFDALKDYIPKGEAIFFEVSNKKQVDATQCLVLALQNAIYFAKAKDGMVSTLIKEMSYPLCLLGGLIAMINLFSTRVAPQLQLGGKGASFVGFVTGFVHYQAVLFALLIAITSLLTVFMLKGQGKLRNNLNIIPCYGIYRRLENAKVLRIIALLMQQGATLNDALGFAKRNASPYTTSHLKSMQERLLFFPEMEAIKTGFFNSSIEQAIQHRFRFEHIEAAFNAIADKSINQARTRIAIYSKLFTYITYGVLAVFVTQFVGALYSPITQQF